MSDGTDGASATELAVGNAQTYMNNARQYAAQANSAATTASNFAQAAATAAKTTATQVAALLALVSGAGLVPESIEDTDAMGFGRLGQLYSVSYAMLKKELQAGMLHGENNLSDVANPAAALAALGGVAQSSIKSSLVTNASNGPTVSTAFCFTPGTDGFLTVLSQGGAAGTNAVSVSLVIAVDTVEGATLLNSNSNSNGSYNIASFSAQFAVTALVPVTVVIKQSAPSSSTQSNLSSFFIYLPS